jgi:hypothetical protein
MLSEIVKAYVDPVIEETVMTQGGSLFALIAMVLVV